MIESFLRGLKVISKPQLLKTLIHLGTDNGYLTKIGWRNSFLKRMPVDANDNPLPWVTYSFIDFIEKRLDSNLTVFEYGSGNSTLYYSKFVKSVTSVEHEKDWALKIKNTMPSNVTLQIVDVETNGLYSRFAYDSKIKYDIIIVDGRDRVNCLRHGFQAITDRGVIVLDDSEREYYSEGIEFLLNKGFKKIDFWGISPGLYYKKATSIFYKGDNCLNI